MYQLVYTSLLATREFPAADLKKLLVRARLRNKEAGVTGMLVFHDGTFLQALEGEKRAVLDVFSQYQEGSAPSRYLGLASRTGIRGNSGHSAIGRWDLPISPGAAGASSRVSSACESR